MIYSYELQSILIYRQYYEILGFRYKKKEEKNKQTSPRLSTISYFSLILPAQNTNREERATLMR